MRLEITIFDELAVYVNEQATHPLTTGESEESIRRGCEQAEAGEFFEGSMEDIRLQARAKREALLNK